MMNGTAHEKDWYFYHDALSLMTSKKNMEWMSKTKVGGLKLSKRWLLPQLRVNKGTPYEGKCVGNSPEFMPMDNSLNADLTRSNDFHCRVTSKLDRDDPRKFSMETPKSILRGIHQLFECAEGEDGVPDSKRIIHDCDQVWDSIYAVYQNKGAIV